MAGSSETSGSTGAPSEDDATTSTSVHDGGSLPPVLLDVASVPDAPPADYCPLVTFEGAPAQVPSDIIVAVDTSGSMAAEANAVEVNLNRFSSQVLDAGIDARVVLVAAGASQGGPCIGAPLGSGSCPDDDNEPLFRHVDAVVDSWDALVRVVDSYPDFADLMRPDAVKQVVVVSDDNSWKMTAADFDLAFSGLDLSHFGYTFHGIVSAQRCVEAASVGEVYLELAEQTGGAIGDLCGQDFEPVFDDLAAAVIESSVPCTYPLSEQGAAPSQLALAEVELDTGEGALAVTPVESAAQCGVADDAWFLDAGAEAIVLCPKTCARVKHNPRVRVEVAVPCANPAP